MITRYVSILAITAFLLPQLVNGIPTTPVGLKEIIKKANPYDVIDLGPGTYYGPVVIDKPLTIKGHRFATIDGRGIGDVITISSEDVTIDGLRIMNSYPDVALEPAGIKILNASNVLITNSVILNVVHAIYVIHSENVSIVSNSIVSIPEKTPNDRGHGVYLWYSRGVKIVSNGISRVKDGVYSDHSYGVEVIGNSISHSRYGIHLMYSYDHEIRSNLIRKNIVGMALMYSCNLMVSENEVAENRGIAVGDGVFIRESCEVELRRNLIYGNPVGIDVVNSPYPRHASLVVEGNVIAFNYVGILIDVWAGGSIVRNDMLENARQIRIFTDSRPLVVLSGNFYSDRPMQLGKRYVVEALDDELFRRWPELQLLSYSLAMNSLKEYLSTLQGGSQPKAIDDSPLEYPNIGIATKVGGSIAMLALSALLTSIPIAIIVLVSRVGGYRGHRGK